MAGPIPAMPISPVRPWGDRASLLPDRSCDIDAAGLPRVGRVEIAASWPRASGCPGTAPLLPSGMVRPISSPGPGLRGRRRECEALDQLLDAVRAGHSSVLVLRGESGVGKTALLELRRERASGCRVARVGGRRVGDGPAVRRPAPAVRTDAGSAGRPARSAAGCAAHRVRAARRGCRRIGSWSGLAVLSLLSEAAEERPLRLPGRRRAVAGPGLGAGAGVRGAARCWPTPSRWCSRCASPATTTCSPGCRSWSCRGLWAMRMHGGCWSRRSRAGLDERVRDRIIAETRGNPLALLELPRGLTAAELAGGFARARRAAAGEPDRAQLPPQAAGAPRRHAAAAAGGGCRAGRDVTLLWRAAELLGDQAGCRDGGGGRRADRASAPPGCGSATRWSGRRSTGRRPPETARRCIARWPRRPIRRPTPTAGPGIAHARR